jgi:hypothetical protein
MDVYLINCSKSKFALVRVLTGIKWSANEVVMEFQNILPPHKAGFTERLEELKRPEDTFMSILYRSTIDQKASSTDKK